MFENIFLDVFYLHFIYKIKSRITNQKHKSYYKLRDRRVASLSNPCPEVSSIVLPGLLSGESIWLVSTVEF